MRELNPYWSNGYCEDAPCCGCCGQQVDLNYSEPSEPDYNEPGYDCGPDDSDLACDWECACGAENDGAEEVCTECLEAR